MAEANPVFIEDELHAIIHRPNLPKRAMRMSPRAYTKTDIDDAFGVVGKWSTP